MNVWVDVEYTPCVWYLYGKPAPCTYTGAREGGLAATAGGGGLVLTRVTVMLDALLG